MNRGLLGTVGLCLLISGCVSSSRLSTSDTARSVPAVASGAHSEWRRFDIPAEDARVALNEWSKQGNMQVLFDYSALGGRQTQAVEGRLPPRDALESMLKDTGLTFTVLNENTVAVAPDRQRP